jgi:hypothetical protein
MHTSTRSTDEDLIGAELMFGAMPIGHILGVRRDPISKRVWRLIAVYGAHGRQVSIPIEWIARRTPRRVTLAVGTRELDDMRDQRELGPLFVRPDVPHVNGAAV